MPKRKKVFDREQQQKRYAEKNVNDKLVFSLRMAHRTMHALYEGKGSWKRVLIVLNETGVITQKALTERLGIQPGSVSDVLAKMEGMGLLRRSPSESDQRTTDVALTDTGVREALAAAEQRRHRHEEMFSCLTDAEKADLLRLLEKLNADWEERYGAAGCCCGTAAAHPDSV